MHKRANQKPVIKKGDCFYRLLSGFLVTFTTAITITETVSFAMPWKLNWIILVLIGADLKISISPFYFHKCTASFRQLVQEYICYWSELSFIESQIKPTWIEISLLKPLYSMSRNKQYFAENGWHYLIYIQSWNLLIMHFLDRRFQSLIPQPTIWQSCLLNDT